MKPKKKELLFDPADELGVDALDGCKDIISAIFSTSDCDDELARLILEKLITEEKDELAGAEQEQQDNIVEPKNRWKKLSNKNGWTE